MRDDSAPPPADEVGERALAALVARRYYIDHRSRTAIARELGTSAAAVARLLEFARTSGIVRIRIGTDREGECRSDR